MHLYITIYLLLFVSPLLHAQTEPALRRIDAAEWKRASSGLDYRKDVPGEIKPPPPPTRSPHGIDWTLNTGLLGNLIQALVVLIAVGAIGYGIYQMLQAPRSRKITGAGVEITLENLDQYLDETDLDQFLKAALTDKNYALAIRLYYLQMIKTLAARHIIKWAKEKTNRDYLRDMREHRLRDEFRRLTAEYERVWYGNQHPDATAFATMEPAYRQFLQQISH
jgi:hypothetical protein